MSTLTTTPLETAADRFGAATTRVQRRKGWTTLAALIASDIDTLRAVQADLQDEDGAPMDLAATPTSAQRAARATLTKFQAATTDSRRKATWGAFAALVAEDGVMLLDMQAQFSA